MSSIRRHEANLARDFWKNYVPANALRTRANQNPFSPNHSEKIVPKKY
jgi:hypothetical protein